MGDGAVGTYVCLCVVVCAILKLGLVNLEILLPGPSGPWDVCVPGYLIAFRPIGFQSSRSSFTATAVKSRQFCSI